MCNTIEIVKGDTRPVTVTYKDHGRPVDPPDGTVIHVQVRKAPDGGELMIDAYPEKGSEPGEYIWRIEASIPSGEYVYDVQAEYPSGDVSTFIKLSKFVVLPGSTEKGGT